MNHVFPEFSSPLGYMRARACWMVQYFSEITFGDDNHLQYALQQVRRGGGREGGGRGGREGGEGGREEGGEGGREGGREREGGEGGREGLQERGYHCTVLDFREFCFNKLCTKVMPYL